MDVLDQLSRVLKIPIERLFFSSGVSGLVDDDEIARRRALPRTERVNARALHLAIEEAAGRKPKAGATKKRPTYEVSYRPIVAEDVVRWGLESADFVPTLEELIDELETNPKQFPPKSGKLAGTRAAEVFYRGTTWRVVFDVDDDFSKSRSLQSGRTTSPIVKPNGGDDGRYRLPSLPAILCNQGPHRLGDQPAGPILERLRWGGRALVMPE